MSTTAQRFETFGPSLGEELGDPAERIEDLENLRNDLLDVADAIRADNRELTVKYLRRLRQWNGREPQTWLAKLGGGEQEPLPTLNAKAYSDGELMALALERLEGGRS